nr:Aldose sugar dehydrogenase YliI [Candidatus Nanopelagicales bacterium]
MLKRTFLIAALLLGAASPVHAADFEGDSLSLTFTSKSISKAVTGGGNTRGPALALLKDDTILLGGGRNGGELLTWNKAKTSLISLGKFIPANRREIDSRFAINDIAVLTENPTSAKLLISYPRLSKARNCVEIAIDEIAYDRAKPRAKFVSNWFVTKPCVPISAVQHTAGRFAVIDKNTVYVTIGDLGFSEIDNRAKRGDLGSIFRLTAKSATKVSQGHRNPQGIVIFDSKTLMAAEHGPRGGDEINIIESGGDYGWPFVSYGQPYGGGDYVRPEKTGSHEGYIEPIKYWVPSIAPTELVQLPEEGWGNWGRSLVLGTLREEVLVFIKINDKFSATEDLQVNIGDRIRDLEVLSSGALLATTDSGKLITVTNE